MHRTRLIGLVSAAVLAAACGTSLARPPVGTEFTYQGQLLKAGQALTGNADFRFTLFDGPGPAANVVGTIQNVANIPVDQGRFECAVNFGESPYTTNEERWMQVEVRNPSGIGNFSLMGERQKLTASPFSLATRGLNVDAAGNVGIGTATPFNRLDVADGSTIGSSFAIGPNVSEESANRGTKVGFGWSFNDNCGLNFTGMKVECVAGGNCGFTANSFDLGFWTAACNVSCPREVMRINGNGDVGIGTSAPRSRLHIGGPIVPHEATTSFMFTCNSGFAGGFTNDQLTLGQFYYATPGGHQASLGIRTRKTSAIESWTGTAVGIGMDVDATQFVGGSLWFNSGRVGINTANPTRGVLEVNGAAGSSAIGNHAYFGPSGVALSGGAGFTGPTSIHATNDIHCLNLRVFSDARIKNIKGRSDGAKDLDTLLNVEITDYTFKDTIAKGTEAQKKVIGQQLEEVYPLAVRKTSDIIPDIYTKAPVQGGWVMLGTDLKVGDKVRVIGMDAQTESTVAEIKDGAFRVADLPAGDEVFVYGREVSDFRVVDYEAIAMLNVSATQELARQNMAMKKQIEELQTQYETRLAKLEAALTDKSTATASK